MAVLPPTQASSEQEDLNPKPYIFRMLQATEERKISEPLSSF